MVLWNYGIFVGGWTAKIEILLNFQIEKLRKTQIDRKVL